jgi:hypothetical protein
MLLIRIISALILTTGKLQCSAPAGRHWTAPTTTQQKSIDFDHEIMNLVEKNVGTPAILGRTLTIPL